MLSAFSNEWMLKAPCICPLNEVTGRHFSKVTCYLLELREALANKEAPLAGTPSQSHCEHRRVPGCFVIRVSVSGCPWKFSQNFPLDLRLSYCLLTSPGLFLCGCHEVSLLQEKSPIDNPQPTPENDCWLDRGLFPPKIQFEAGGIVRQPLRHLQLSLCCGLLCRQRKMTVFIISC